MSPFSLMSFRVPYDGYRLEEDEDEFFWELSANGLVIAKSKGVAGEEGELEEKLEKLKREFYFYWVTALNTPVLATEEVLAGLPKDAKVYTVDEKTGDDLRCTFDNEFGWGCRTGYFDEALKLGRPYKIFAINDPKTADYLRQFTLEGVRKETKDV
jgi:hypothetical protein